MMPLRATAAAGLLSLLLVLPAVAQSIGPAEGGVQRDQSARSEPAAPAAEEAQPSRDPQARPPARADDEFDPPPVGCRYRENKLDLLV